MSIIYSIYFFCQKQEIKSQIRGELNKSKVNFGLEDYVRKGTQERSTRTKRMIVW